MNYRDSDPEARTADFEESMERDYDRMDMAEQLADESRDDLALEDGSYCAFWISRVERSS